MSEDIGKKINQIAEMLGAEDMPDNLKNLIGLIAGSIDKNDLSNKANEVPAAKESKTERNELSENIEMMRKVKTVMDRLYSNKDPRINLLTAIKPFLNSKRQKRVNNCIALLNITTIARILEEQEKNDLQGGK